MSQGKSLKTGKTKRDGDHPALSTVCLLCRRAARQAHALYGGDACRARASRARRAERTDRWSEQQLRLRRSPPASAPPPAPARAGEQQRENSERENG